RWLGDTSSVRAGWYTRAGAGTESEVTGERIESGQLHHSAVASGAARSMGDASSARLEGRAGEPGDHGQKRAAAERASRAVGGFWHDAEWIYCRDDNWRPVEPGTFPLAHGAPARVGRTRATGNAIVAPLAQIFIEAFAESLQYLWGDSEQSPR